MSERAAKAGGERPVIIIKKKKGGHAGHHGGAWKVAYADFVTAMMAFFLVMWLLTQADLKLRSQIAAYFRDPGILAGGAIINSETNIAKSRDPQTISKDLLVLQGREQDQRRTGPLDADTSEEQAAKAAARAEQEQLETEAKAIRADIAQAVAKDPDLAGMKDQVIVQVTDAGLSIQVVDKGRQLLFDLSSAELKPPLVAVLKRIAAVLGRLPNPIQIGGHTDARPYPADSTMTNWDLSFLRANAARRILETSGLRPRQVNRVLAYADSQPLVPENPLADENRRLSILAERLRGKPPENDAPSADAPARP